MKCPLCGGKLISKKVPYYFEGINFGNFDAYVCNKCKESFMREKHLQSIENFAKERGVWGIGIISHIDVSTSDKKNVFLIDIPQLFNRPEKIPYIRTSI